MTEQPHTNPTADPEVKAALKEALREWLDSQFLMLGKWTARGIAAAVLSALVYWIIQTNGFHR